MRPRIAYLRQLREARDVSAADVDVGDEQQQVLRLRAGWPDHAHAAQLPPREAGLTVAAVALHGRDAAADEPDDAEDDDMGGVLGEPLAERAPAPPLPRSLLRLSPRLRRGLRLLPLGLRLLPLGLLLLADELPQPLDLGALLRDGLLELVDLLLLVLAVGLEVLDPRLGRLGAGDRRLHLVAKHGTEDSR